MMPVVPMMMPMMPMMVARGPMVVPVSGHDWHRHTQKEYSRSNEQRCVYTSFHHGMLSFVQAGLTTLLNVHQGSSLPEYERQKKLKTSFLFYKNRYL